MNITSDKSSVAVVGAGVSGLTTGILLLLKEYQVAIYTKEKPTISARNPDFASLYPSASVIPHSVHHPDLTNLFILSQCFFKSLYSFGFPGLTIHEHYECYTSDQEIPSYAHEIEEFAKIDNSDWHPAHPDFRIKSAWKFNCFFADWSIYYQYLFNTFIKLGGKLVLKEIDLNKLETIDDEIVINCSGMGSHSLRDELTSPLILKGHLIHVKGAPLLRTPSDAATVSFNYTPGADIYSDKNGNALDVYCYPRKDGWIIGGSRIEGTLNQNGEFISRFQEGLDFHKHIEELNQPIIQHSFGVDLNQFREREYLHSYRYVRNRESGIRLEKEERGNKLILHNYGHGGAGVTLSWGCALRAIELLNDKLYDSEIDRRYTAQNLTHQLSSRL